ncbi:hypothetical protein [Ideonella dechloratans]|uniref:hypothetical protein n=2 Tax=Ideonella dechloratans TaxID=36863 RepID=UPI0035AF13E6
MSLRMCALTLCNTTAHFVHVLVTKGEQMLARLPPHGTLRLPWGEQLPDDGTDFTVVAVIGGHTTGALVLSDRQAVISVRAGEWPGRYELELG